MEFDKSRVYTVVNANELEAGDLVIVGDTMAMLRFRASEETHLAFLCKVESDDCSGRFLIDTKRYPLAYLVCPARNAEAWHAWKAGERVEYKSPDGWVEVPAGRELDWCNNEFRVKPEPKFRPFNSVDELCEAWAKRGGYRAKPGTMPLIWVQPKNVKIKYLIIQYDVGDRYNPVRFAERWWSFKELYDDYEFLDGSPFGVEEARDE